jgi:glycosyltransferase involved in cell wall biosynthesis
VVEPQPKVSVLIPCWNAAGSIGRALASVLEAEERALQVIVVDDASQDGTAAVVRAIADRDPRVELVVAPGNGGASAARNLGLPLVRGEWLSFLDADDRLLPGGLDALHRAAVDTDALAVVGQRIWSDGTRTWIASTYDTPDLKEPGRKSLVRNPGLMFNASTTGKLFHRSVIDGLRFEGRVLGDQPWTLRALLRAGDRIQVIDDVVYEWTRPAPGQTISTITEDKRRSAARAAEAVRVAIGAWWEVARAAEETVPDAAGRHVIRSAYLERLVRSDFAGPVVRAVETRDPATAELFAALRDFVVALPPDLVGASREIPAKLLWVPLNHWDRVPVDARPAFWDLVRALPAGPVTRLRASRHLPAQVAVRIARGAPGTGGERAAGVIAGVTSAAGRLRPRRRA